MLFINIIIIKNNSEFRYVKIFQSKLKYSLLKIPMLETTSETLS